MLKVKVRVKVQVTPEQATKVRRESRGQLYLSMNSALDRGGWSTPRPGRFTPGREIRYLYRKLGGPQGQSGRVRKFSPHRDSIPGPSIQ